MRLFALSSLALPILAFASLDDQTAMSGSILDESAPYTPQTNSQPTLADLLTIESSASIYYSYARETELSTLFGDESAHLTLLVPTNKAVMALARKPHEGPAPVKDGAIISEAEFDALSKENVVRWVSAHIIPQSPISVTSSQPYHTMLQEKNVTFTQVDSDESKPDWSRVRLNDDVRLIDMTEVCLGFCPE
ncbi:uncharacterized protein C8Q71DRAFT_790200 [Rhodofomes roseus]|uniref:FAS1 domain-containing protein n=1 Tax=Rhodofomes roseus TaxID=34475 RepID=A0ABQ8JYT2_9APHY|nr:uncharacterized protein C8Q71DRAFT_790200 [Rhodofomes roseus]KAH9829439.1 hypothetical protein C8Q71DRAFT_790200 [Rhodofomes roseus]